MAQFDLELLILAAVFLMAGVFARHLIDFNLWIYKRIGLVSLADFWKRQLKWWLPTVRAVAIIGAVAFFVIGTGIL